VPAFTFGHRSLTPWLQALQLPRSSFAAKNPVLAHTASSYYISSSALACRVPGGLRPRQSLSPDLRSPPVLICWGTPFAYSEVIVRLFRCQCSLPPASSEDCDAVAGQRSCRHDPSTPDILALRGCPLNLRCEAADPVGLGRLFLPITPQLPARLHSPFRARVRRQRQCAAPRRLCANSAGSKQACRSCRLTTPNRLS
jgi:hypothetical protein